MKLVITERVVRQALARLHAQGKLVRLSPDAAGRRVQSGRAHSHGSKA
jgi:DNA-binding transcriptional regulator PaaX